MVLREWHIGAVLFVTLVNLRKTIRRTRCNRLLFYYTFTCHFCDFQENCKNKSLQEFDTFALSDDEIKAIANTCINYHKSIHY